MRTDFLRVEACYGVSLQHKSIPDQRMFVPVWATSKEEAKTRFMRGAYPQNPFFHDYEIKDVWYRANAELAEEPEDLIVLVRYFVNEYGDLEYEWEDVHDFEEEVKHFNLIA